MADAARSALTGTRYVRIMSHWGGDQWTVNVRTRTSETPDGVDVVATIAAKGAAPAGVLVVHDSYSPTRTYADSHLPTRADWDAVLDPRLTFEELGAPTS
jgi:alcohol dehydrogenase YqhD (iron-dependent ADH family)